MKKKEQKFYSKEIKKSKQVNEDYKRVVSLFIVLFIVCGLLFGLYLLNGKYVSKDLFQDDKTTTKEVSYDDTLLTVSNLFKVTDKEYYVMAYDASDELRGFLYSNLVVNFKEVDIPLYSIDLSNAMNKKYYNTKGEENTKPTKYEEVMFTRPTLVHVKNGKVFAYVTDLDEMVRLLTEERKEDK